MKDFDRKVLEWKARQRILELDVERFFSRLDLWSRVLAWVAGAGALVIIARMLVKIFYPGVSI